MHQTPPRAALLIVDVQHGFLRDATRHIPARVEALQADYPLVIDKSRYTCIDTDFLALLDQHRIDEVHLCGIATDNCVLKCAVDLFEAGRTPVVLAEACASHAGADFHDTALRILERLIGREQVRRAQDFASPSSDAP